MSLRFSYKLGIFHVFSYSFLQSQIGDNGYVTPFVFRKTECLPCLVYLFFLPAIRSRVEPFFFSSEIACLVLVIQSVIFFIQALDAFRISFEG